MTRIDEEAKKKVLALTLEKACGLLSGRDRWTTFDFPELKIWSVRMADGPHGIRQEIDDGPECIKAIGYPPLGTLAQSFDPRWLYRLGTCLAYDARERDIDIVLGPGINHKRSPYGGRNFEYLSEDPFLSGTLATSYVKGLQDQGIGACVKHFAGNSQETARMVNDSIIDERALREIYLKAFEMVVKDAHPWSIMTAYNRLNGVHASENSWLLQQVARQEWGFDGVFISDWGAINEVLPSFINGLDLEMPGTCVGTKQEILDGIRDEHLDMDVVRHASERLVKLSLQCHAKKEIILPPVERRLEEAEAMAVHSAVLLKNEGHILPISQDKSLIVLGRAALHPTRQGGGSSAVDLLFSDHLLDGLKDGGHLASYQDVDSGDDSSLQQALIEIQKYDYAIVMVSSGLDSHLEGSDRPSLALSTDDVRLIEEVAKAKKETIVVLEAGGVVEMPWVDQVPALLYGGFGGSRGGHALAKVLLGIANPSGKLAETFPLRGDDNPSSSTFGRDPFITPYEESLFTGYRYYDAAQAPVRFPFGFGLSYTTFALKKVEMSLQNEELVIRGLLENTGKVDGAEVIQVYIGKPQSAVMRAVKELKAFQKIYLKAGEKERISFHIPLSELRYYDVASARWILEGGSYQVELGTSSRHILVTQAITVPGEELKRHQEIPESYRLPLSFPLQVQKEDFLVLLGRPLPLRRPVRPFSLDSTFAEIRTTFVGRMFEKQALKRMGNNFQEHPEQKAIYDKSSEGMPLRIMSMSGFVTRPMMHGIVDLLNGHYWTGYQKLRKKKS